jgi:m7GpppX diphosphatase
MITETAQIYHQAVLPWIAAQPTSRIQWVHNILSGVKEAEKVLFRDEDPDTGFIILPDRYHTLCPPGKQVHTVHNVLQLNHYYLTHSQHSKWDGRTLSSLYLLAISQRGDIRSLRDLKTEHLPLLKNIRDKVLAMIPQKFPGVAEDEVRLFVHYHPSYCKSKGEAQLLPL